MDEKTPDEISRVIVTPGTTRFDAATIREAMLAQTTTIRDQIRESFAQATISEIAAAQVFSLREAEEQARRVAQQLDGDDD